MLVRLREVEVARAELDRGHRPGESDRRERDTRAAPALVRDRADDAAGPPVERGRNVETGRRNRELERLVRRSGADRRHADARADESLGGRDGLLDVVRVGRKVAERVMLALRDLPHLPLVPALLNRRAQGVKVDVGHSIAPFGFGRGGRAAAAIDAGSPINDPGLVTNVYLASAVVKVGKGAATEYVNLGRTGLQMLCERLAWTNQIKRTDPEPSRMISRANASLTRASARISS